MVSRLLAVFACIVFAPALASAQGELMHIDFQENPPYSVRSWNGNSQQLQTINSPGPKGPGVFWGFTRFASGGFNNRAYVRHNWWDTDVSGIASVNSGWTASGSMFRPSGGWQDVPYYLRFRVRTSSPIMPHTPTSACDGDTQMKFFIWNAFTPEGTDRVIMMFHAGSSAGGTNANHTTIQLRAGVSGSWTRTVFPNREWVNVQMAWRWGPEGTAYQRIYINNNNLNAPTSENLQFNDLDMHGTPDRWGPAGVPRGLDNQFFFGDIDNTGSCVSEDAGIDLQDVELATQFDPNWATGGSNPTSPTAPANLRILPGGDAVAFAFFPIGALGLMLGVRRMRD